MQADELESLFAQNLRTRREELGLSQVVLAEKAGIPQPHLSALERGKMAPTLATLARIAEALDTTPSVLLSTTFTVASKIPSKSG